MNSLAGQTYAFLMTILAGGIVGFLFDLYRIMRSAFRPRQIATAIWDLLFWIVVAPVLFATLLASNWGELRFYVAIGLGLGLLLYFQAFSQWVIWFLSGLSRGVAFFFRSTVRMGLRGVKFPFDVVTRRFRRVPFGSFEGFRVRPVRPKVAWRRFSFRSLFHR